MNVWLQHLMTLCGIILALTPLAMWVAPTIAILVLIIVVGIVAAAVLCLLDFYDEHVGDLKQAGPEVSKLSFDEFMATMHRLYPLSYHHGRRRDPVFAREMERLKRLLKS